jgi:hypothetical protein
MNVTNEEQTGLPRARLGLALKKGFRDTYDYLGLVIGSTLISGFLVLASMFLRQLLAGHVAGLWADIGWFAAIVLVGAPFLAGVFRMGYKIVYRDDPGLGDLVSGFRELLLGSWALAGINVFVVGMLLVDAAFFFGILGPLKGNVIGHALGALILYVLLMWCMMAMYQLPALAAQGPLGQRRGAVAAVKKSFLFVAHNPGFTIGLFVAILGFGILCILSVIGMLILSVGAASILLTHATRELFIRYGVVEEPEVPKDDSWSG